MSPTPPPVLTDPADDGPTATERALVEQYAADRRRERRAEPGRRSTDHLPSIEGIDPDRPLLAQLVDQAIGLAERTGEQRADARHSALLDRLAGVVRQRQDLAAEQDRQAERAESSGNADRADACSRWAAELRGQVDALRSILDPAEQAEVAGRVAKLREQVP